MGVSLFLIHTFLAQWLNPTYQSQKNREKIVTIAQMTDKLAKEVKQQQFFIQALQNIIEDSTDQNKITQEVWIKKIQKKQFIAPIKGIITAKFNANHQHYGIDIVAPKNTPIVSIEDGVVLFSGYNDDTGWVIIIQHKNNYVSIYKHNKNLHKKMGDFIKKNEKIATLGNTGKLTSGPHLHFELWYAHKAINPEEYINF